LGWSENVLSTVLGDIHCLQANVWYTFNGSRKLIVIEHHSQPIFIEDSLVMLGGWSFTSNIKHSLLCINNNLSVNAVVIKK
jgi:hypothetical protein